MKLKVAGLPQKSNDNYIDMGLIFMKEVKRFSLRLGFVIALVTILSFPVSVTAISLDQATAFASNFGSGFGDLIDIWKVSEEGNDNVNSVADHLAGTTWLSDEQKLTELARNESEFYSEGLLNISLYPNLLSYADSEGKVGLWAYEGHETVDFLAVASAGYVALYGYEPSATSGGWTTADIAGFINDENPNLRGMSHISAYNIGVVPLPAAAPLFASALAVFGFVTYRRSKK